MRDGFVIRSKEYLLILHLWKTFIRKQVWREVLIAEVEGEPVSAVLILFHFAGKSWFIIWYVCRPKSIVKLMPNYLIQWETMKLSRRTGLL